MTSSGNYAAPSKARVTCQHEGPLSGHGPSTLRARNSQNEEDNHEHDQELNRVDRAEPYTPVHSTPPVSNFRTRWPLIQSALLFAAVAALAACAGVSPRLPLTASIPDAARESGFHVERSELEYRAEQPWRELRLVNPHGDLRIRRGVAGAVGLSVVVQRLAPEWLQPLIEQQQTPGTLTLTVRYAEPAPGAQARFGRVGRVDLVAFVPEDGLLIAETDDGALLIRHRQGPVQARSRQGRIRASSATALQIENDSGPTLARLVGAGPLSASTLHSGTGTIDLALPRLAAWALEVDAAGGVLPGLGWYPADDFQVPLGATHLRRQNGTGGAPIRVQSAVAVSIGAVAELPEGGLPPDPAED